MPVVAVLCAACGGGSGAQTQSVASDTATGADTTTSAPASPVTQSPAPALPAAPQVPALSARFIAPVNGQFSVNPATPFSWNPVSGASYELQVGTRPGTNDIYESGIIAATSVVVPRLPKAGVVYARVRAIPQGWSTDAGGHWVHGANIAFSMDTTAPGAAMIYPSAQAAMVAGQGFSWTPDPLAVSYSLSLGTQGASGSLLQRTGLHATRLLAAGLPVGVRLHATLTTVYADHARSSTVEFTVSDNTISTAQQMAVGRLLAADVRGLADPDNEPLGGSALEAAMLAAGEISADCTSFADTLIQFLGDAQITLAYDRLGVCFNAAPADCHSLVEIYDPDTGRASTLDPTFGLTTLLADGTPATPQEISAAAQTLNWSGLQFEFLTGNGDAYARAYYIDYPLLFLRIYAGQVLGPAPATLAPYYSVLGPTVTGTSEGYYAVVCAPGAAWTTGDFDWGAAALPCSAGLTAVTEAVDASITPGDSSAVAIASLRRFVF